MLTQIRSELDAALKHMRYGIYVVTTITPKGAHGLTASWVMQVSKEPPMVAVALREASASERAISAAGAFAVNILAEEDTEMAERFITPVNRFEVPPALNIKWGLLQLPLLENALGWLECQLKGRMEMGDHILLIGEVIGGRLNKEGRPLTTMESGLQYGGLHKED
jgi:flavin reductase (DIM6/NTAB) family NADH-FMN oxidoreductase RutF